MQKQKVVLIGGGGHCRACIDVIEATEQYTILGVLDDHLAIASSILDYTIIGTDAEISRYHSEGCMFLITVGQIKSSKIRGAIFNLLKENEGKLITPISPKAYVSKYAEIGYGTIVMHGATVNANASIGNNCILNTGCNIEHDVSIGSNTHISTSAMVNGGCEIGNYVFIGSNATISNHVKISDNSIIGAGAVVINDIVEPGIYVGNPAIKK